VELSKTDKGGNTLLDFLKEFYLFLAVRKKFWLIPILLTSALLAFLILFSQGSTVAPFIYTLF